MPPKLGKKQAVKIDPTTGKPTRTFGVWDAFKPDETSGYSWFSFDTTNWLTSATVNAMTYAEQGLYCRALAVQWRDGSLFTNPIQFARQVGCDARTAKRFLAAWGAKVFTCMKHPCNQVATCLQPSRNQDATISQQSGCTDVATWNPSCNHMVNGKLTYLALSKGVPNVADFTEEKETEKGDGEGESDLDIHHFVSSDATHPLTRPFTVEDGAVTFDPAVHGCFNCNEAAVSCACTYPCGVSGCYNPPLQGIDNLAAHIVEHNLNLTLAHDADGMPVWVGLPADEFLLEDDLEEMI